MSPQSRARLSDLATALDDLLQTHAPKDLASIVGCHRTTPGERGPDPAAWPIDDLMHLADVFPAIDDAWRNLRSSDPLPATTAETAERATQRLIATMGGEIQRLAERLAHDGLNAAELRDTDNDFISLAAQISQARALIRQRRRSA